METNGGKMYVGLDMGTNSVGLAVTDENYNLYRAKGKDYWCSRLFSEANTAVDRRVKRIARRRRQREVARQGILREFFADEIAKVDEGFYARLDESRYYIEDRDDGHKYTLFVGGNYSDKDYFRDYPTIFHLRKELIESDKPHDVRLVYLAIANMFKHRGHFLNESLGSDSPLPSMKNAYNNFINASDMYVMDFPKNVDDEELESILGNRGASRTQILENVSNYLSISKKDNKAEYELLKIICGMKGKLITIYGEAIIDDENKDTGINFRDSNYEEQEMKAIELLGDEYFELIQAAKEIHDIAMLSSIMKGYKFLSESRVQQYEEHKADLKLLQKVIRKYVPEKYNDMFRYMKDGNYSAYVGSVNSFGKKIRRNGGNGRSQEDFYKYVISIIKPLTEEYPDDEDIKLIEEKIKNETFMPKQLTASNGVIPNQLHALEMKAILSKAETYLPFLLSKDESGHTLSERIVMLFTFHIPYYVGPLGQNHIGETGYNIWARRRPGEEKGRIYPWNFEQKIDTKAAAEEFIKRMVRHCTYLDGEITLPKCSLLYEKYMVLNELNNLKINGEKPEVSVKQDIYHELFEEGKRVTLDKLKTFLYNHSLIESKNDVIISGIDGGFNTSLTTVGKFRGVLGDKVLSDDNQKMIEDIVFWGTVYGNDKKFLRERIQEKYGTRLDANQIKRITGFKFNGWGRLSKKFLELEGKCECGECSIICALWNTNHNLMELLSDNYTYRKSMEELVEKKLKPLTEWTIEDLDEEYLSAPVKRMVWQTIKMLREVQEVTGKEPDRIFVEMPRENGEKGDRKKSRKQKLLDLYNSIKNESRDWKSEINE
ncbi:MAG: type II CRISPR RNA-guided endonuclease Cas9, partial [Coprococcus sp.]